MILYSCTLYCDLDNFRRVLNLCIYYISVLVLTVNQEHNLDLQMGGSVSNFGSPLSDRYLSGGHFEQCPIMGMTSRPVRLKPPPPRVG